MPLAVFIRAEVDYISMKKDDKEGCGSIPFTGDNPENLRKVLACYKNVLVCGIKGVGKITNTIKAVKENANVCYIGNPVDFEGKRRPGSYEKYIGYIMSLKKDLKVIDDITRLFRTKDNLILIVDEIYGRSDSQLEQISRLCDMENIQVIQIVGCLKYMGKLIDKIDVILQFHPDTAFTIDKEFAKAICDILGKKQAAIQSKLPLH